VDVSDPDGCSDFAGHLEHADLAAVLELVTLRGD
jgi:hypothetical protein